MADTSPKSIEKLSPLIQATHAYIQRVGRKKLANKLSVNIGLLMRKQPIMDVLELTYDDMVSSYEAKLVEARAASPAPQPWEAIEIAWGIIANAGGGDWERESKDWQEAAAKWRDKWVNRMYESKRSAFPTPADAVPPQLPAKLQPVPTFSPPIPGNARDLDPESEPLSAIQQPYAPPPAVSAPLPAVARDLDENWAGDAPEAPPVVEEHQRRRASQEPITPMFVGEVRSERGVAEVQHGIPFRVANNVPDPAAERPREPDGWVGGGAAELPTFRPDQFVDPNAPPPANPPQIISPATAEQQADQLYKEQQLHAQRLANERIERERREREERAPHWVEGSTKTREVRRGPIIVREGMA